MPTWKKNIFVRVITARMASENRAADIIIAEYVTLTAAEKTEILSAIAAQ